MHLPDGIVPVQMALAGYGGAGLLAAVALSRIKQMADPSAAIPRAAMLTTVFFAASLVAIPVPPASVHLVLAGLLGVVLGWFAVPAILVGLFLQAVLFGHGGLTTLGLNGLILGLPALLSFGIWQVGGMRWPDLAALCAGCGAVLAAVAIFAGLVLVGLPVALDPTAERAALQAFALAHIPLMLAEGVIVVAVLRVLRRAAPHLLSYG